jgi:hypothetical protein
MHRLKPIRRVPRRGLSRGSRRIGDMAFCALLAFAAGLIIGQFAPSLLTAAAVMLAPATPVQASLAPAIARRSLALAGG